MLTKPYQVPVVLQHDLSIQILLRPVQPPPLLLGKAQSHISECHQSLQRKHTKMFTKCSDLHMVPATEMNPARV